MSPARWRTVRIATAGSKAGRGEGLGSSGPGAVAEWVAVRVVTSGSWGTSRSSPLQAVMLSARPVPSTASAVRMGRPYVARVTPWSTKCTKGTTTTERGPTIRTCVCVDPWRLPPYPFFSLLRPARRSRTTPRRPTRRRAPTTGQCDKDNLSLLNDGKLTVGTDSPAYEPWFVDNDPTNGKGFESAVAYAVADQLGFSTDEVTWVKVPFNSSYKPGPKDFDFDINQISINPKRAEAVDFSDGYYTRRPGGHRAQGDRWRGGHQPRRPARVCDSEHRRGRPR